MPAKATTLYGAQQSRFARYLERREQRRPDLVSREHRRRLLAGLRGRVLEVGCGDGRAFELYPAEVEHVLAVEPDPTARAAAAERARAAPVQVDVVDGSADALPAADESIDAAVAIWVLCSVPDVPAALGELRRVLRAGGELRFYEHVRSANPAFRAVQHVVDELYWTRALGGCRTTRDAEAAIRGAGFEVTTIELGFHSSSPFTVTSAPYVVGVARRPS
jgi:ubiquinone/menaquinone biosynthesis C-methylase UbiE